VASSVVHEIFNIKSLEVNISQSFLKGAGNHNAEHSIAVYIH